MGAKTEAERGAPASIGQALVLEIGAVSLPRPVRLVEPTASRHHGDHFP